MIAYLNAGALEGIVGSTQKIIATKMDFKSHKKYTKYTNKDSG